MDRSDLDDKVEKISQRSYYCAHGFCAGGNCWQQVCCTFDDDCLPSLASTNVFSCGSLVFALESVFNN